MQPSGKILEEEMGAVNQKREKTVSDTTLILMQRMILNCLLIIHTSPVRTGT